MKKSIGKLAALNQINKWLPNSLQEIMGNCKLPLEFIADGAYRYAFRIVGAGLVVKVPKVGRNDKRHAKTEWQVYNKIKRSTNRYVKLKPYLPEIYYFDPKSGIIVMEELKPIKGRKQRIEMEKIDGLFMSYIDNLSEADVHDKNVGVDKKGNIKVLDFGYMHPREQ